VKERLGFRFAAKSQHDAFDQQPAYSDDKRLFGTVEWVLRPTQAEALLGKTSVRISAEYGKGNSNPVNVIPPTNAYSYFFQPLNPAIDNIPGVVLDPRLKVGDPAFTWTKAITVDNRSTISPPAANAIPWIQTPYFIQIPLIFDSPNQLEPGYSTSSALNGIQGIMGRIRFSNPIGTRDFGNLGTISSMSFPGFSAISVQDRNVFDYRNRLLSGDNSLVKKKFNTATAALTQEILNGDGGFEVAFDQQRSKSTRALPFSHGGNGQSGMDDIHIDVGQYLAGNIPNPNVGRPYIMQLGAEDRNLDSVRDSVRATAFYKLELDRKKWTLFGLPLGNHILTGLFNKQTIKSTQEDYQTAWSSPKYPNLAATAFIAGDGLSTGFRQTPVVVQYVGPSLVGPGPTFAPNFNSMSDLRITDVFNGRMPQNGDSYRVTFWDNIAKTLVTDNLQVTRGLNGHVKSKQVVDSSSFVLNSNFFNDGIVSILGWRKDRLKNYQASGFNNRLPDGTIDPSLTILPSATDLDETVNNFSWSVMARLPKRLAAKLPLDTEISAYYNISGNFNPQATRHNLYNQEIATPSGETKEYGFLVELLNRRLSWRLNWFETTQSSTSNDAGGATAGVYNIQDVWIGGFQTAQSSGVDFASIPGVAGSGYNSYAQILAAFSDLLPSKVAAVKNLKLTGGNFTKTPITNLTDTSDLSARGLESEIVGNITRNWRVSLNVAKTETVVSNSVPVTIEVADYLYKKLVEKNLLGIKSRPDINEITTVDGRYALDVGTRLAGTLARDGTVSAEQRKWRVNLVTTYDLRNFSNSFLKRLSVGTGIRWQDKAAVGNPFLTGDRLKQKIVETNPKYTSVSQIATNDPVLDTQFPDLEHPFYAPADFAGDIWVSYRRKIFKNIDWRLQLNVANAWRTTADIPVSINPDGQTAIIRIPNEQRWTLSSQFSF